MSTRTIAELDFAKIKKELIEHIKSNPTFTDYDFEGSALSTLMDILAYNTHYSGYYANMLHNEGFVDTMQKRSSLVSRSKELGHVPRSAKASVALLDIQVFGLTALTIPNQPALEPGYTITSRNDNGEFDFVVTESVPLSVEGGLFFYRNVEARQGRLVSNTFLVEDAQESVQFTIPNADIDTDTLRVFVRNDLGDLLVNQYFLAEDLTNLNSQSNVYFLQESHDGLYQIYFGDNILGIQPPPGAEITVSYLVTDKDVANGCLLFNTPNIGLASSVTPINVNASVGGRERESIEELRRSVVKSFAAQNRAVTTDDYAHILKKKIPFIKSVRVWGGEDNIPPVYGKVFISLQPQDGFRITQSAKDNFIKPEIEKFNLLTVLPEIIDAKFTFLKTDVAVKFNKNRTVTTKSDLISKINLVIKNFFDLEVSEFGKDFLNSKLTEDILDSDPGISSVTISTKNSFRIRPVIGLDSNYTTIESNKVVPGTVESSYFNVFIDGVLRTVSIRDRSINLKTSTDVLGNAFQFADLYLIDVITQEEVIDIGTVRYEANDNASSGVFEFNMNVNSFFNDQSEISIYYDTREEDVYAFRNQILSIDNNIADSSVNKKAGLVIRVEDYEK